MAEKRQPNTPPSVSDGEGVRVFRKHTGHGARRWVMAVVVLVVAAVVLWMLARDAAPNSTSTGAETTVDQGAEPIVDGRTTRRASTPVSVEEPLPPGNDPDDLAIYFEPGDPEPTGAQVIEALHRAGIRSGLGAFNPPGTSPPLEGLAVPDNFDLPPGYVRHHQVTDEGVPIEPILMFAPDVTLYDASGRPIARPANGVVPPELAPPGLPLRWVRVRPPQ